MSNITHIASSLFNFLHQIYMLLHHPSPKLCTKVPSLFYMLWNSSKEIILQSLTFKPLLLILLMVLFLNSDHPDGGFVGDVRGVSCLSRLGLLRFSSFLLLLSISRSLLQSEALHQHLLNWLEHLSQYSPTKFCLPSSMLPSSSSVWEMLVANSGSVIILMADKITLSCFINLHEKMAFSHNVKFFKIR